MEGNVPKLIQEQFPGFDYVLNEELFQNKKPKQDDCDSKIPNQSTQELAEEEEKLKAYLDELKKENFTLQTSIKAWQKTLEIKMAEFKEADLKLEEMHNEIWSEREKFCSRLDEFNDGYGILSNWWETQIKFVSEFENHRDSSGDDEMCRQEVEKLEAEVAELKKEVEELEAKQCIAERDVLTTAEGDSISVRSETTKGFPTELKKKRIFSETNEKPEVHKERELESGLYSFVDLEKVKMAKRRRRNNSLVGDSTLQTSTKTLFKF